MFLSPRRTVDSHESCWATPIIFYASSCHSAHLLCSLYLFTRISLHHLCLKLPLILFLTLIASLCKVLYLATLSVCRCLLTMMGDYDSEICHENTQQYFRSIEYHGSHKHYLAASYSLPTSSNALTRPSTVPLKVWQLTTTLKKPPRSPGA